MTKRLVGTFVLVVGIAAFAGPAVAGNGNGNGNGNDKADSSAASGPAAPSPDSSPGNSENAPGQLKKEAPSSQASTADSGTAGGASQSSPAPEGVKPSNDTAHDTHAPASSNQTKEYGNGKTAGEIAIQNGAPSNTILHGPGNSQPHKATLCGSGHEVDVHALKGKHRQSCGTTPPPPGPVPRSKPSSDPAPGSKPNVTTNNNPSGSGTASPGPSSSSPGPSSSLPVASQPPPRTRSNAVVHGSSGVLAATGTVGGKTLPFTGISLWIFVLAAVVLIVLGVVLLRRSRATA